MPSYWKLIRRSRGFVVWIIAFHCLLTVVARADFRIVEPDIYGGLTILISGTITERDAKALQELSGELERKLVHVHLDSGGGDVFAAMQIGRLIRKYDVFTEIGPPHGDAKCYSSCALIFIAGVKRNIFFDGSLGLHRPYLASVPQNPQAVEKQVPLMLSQVKQYVAEMGITDNFYQQMVNTEPAQMVVYGTASDAELAEARKLGILPAWPSYTKLVPEYDPVYQEVEISYSARRHGVTTSEMRRREIDAEECYKRKDSFDCSQALLWGLSERVFRQRWENAQRCSFDDREKVFALPKKDRRDHPLFIKWETCVRNIMSVGT